MEGLIFDFTLQMRNRGSEKHDGPLCHPQSIPALPSLQQVTLSRRSLHPHPPPLPSCSSHDIQILSLALRPRLCKAHFYSCHLSCRSATECNVLHRDSLPPSFPTDIKPQNSKAERDLRDQPVHPRFYKRNWGTRLSRPTLKVKQSKLSSHCPWAVKRHLPCPQRCECTHPCVQNRFEDANWLHPISSTVLKI